MTNYCKDNFNAFTSVILRYSKNKLLLNSSGMTSCSMLGLMRVLRVSTEILCMELNSHLEWSVNCQYVSEHLSILTKLFFTLTWCQTCMNRKLHVTCNSVVCQLILNPFEGRRRKGKEKAITCAFSHGVVCSVIRAAKSRSLLEDVGLACICVSFWTALSICVWQ